MSYQICCYLDVNLFVLSVYRLLAHEKILSHPGEADWKMNQGNWTSFFLLFYLHVFLQSVAVR